MRDGTTFYYKTKLAQNIVSSGTPQNIGPFGPAVYAVAIATTNAIYMDVGASPTASTSTTLLTPGMIQIDYREGDLISVIQESAAGVVSVTPISK